MKTRNNETEYQEIKKVLLANNLNSPEQVELKIQSMFKAAKLYSFFGTVVALVLCTVLPRYSVFIILIFGIYMAWLWSSSVSSKQYFQRYLEEVNQPEIKHQSD